jgi:hypothetical protein
VSKFWISHFDNLWRQQDKFGASVLYAYSYFFKEPKKWWSIGSPTELTIIKPRIPLKEHFRLCYLVWGRGYWLLNSGPCTLLAWQTLYYLSHALCHTFDFYLGTTSGDSKIMLMKSFQKNFNEICHVLTSVFWSLIWLL